MTDLWTAFILGLAGSLHCAGMCGPLALALPAGGSGRGRFVLGRAGYNLGRLLTYSLLGAAFGLVGSGLAWAGIQRWVSIGLGVALLAGWFASRRFGWSPSMASLLARLRAPLAGLLRRPTFAAQMLLGCLNGVLPCGLVYVAAAGAVATGSVLGAVGYMMAFGAGTWPMMLAIGLSGHLVPIRLRLRFQAAIPASVILLAALLILRGLALGIPYLSPGPGGASCCHSTWGTTGSR